MCSQPFGEGQININRLVLTIYSLYFNLKATFEGSLPYFSNKPVCSATMGPAASPSGLLGIWMAPGSRKEGMAAFQLFPPWGPGAQGYPSLLTADQGRACTSHFALENCAQ